MLFAERGGQLAAIKMQQLGVNVRFQMDVPAIIRRIALAMVGAPVDIGVALTVKEIMAEEAHDIGAGDLYFFLLMKQTLTLDQAAEKFAGGFAVRNRADVSSVNEIGREKIEEDIRALQPQAVGCVLLLKVLS